MPAAMNALRQFFATARQRPIVVTALKVALVVGSILNAINQGQHLFDGTAISLPHVCLNYIVPFCVSTYSATRAAMRTESTTPPQI